MGDKVALGMPPAPITTRNEPASRMILRLLWVVVGGLALLAGLGPILSDVFPSARPGIAIIVIVLAGLWCVAGLFLIAGEWLAKRSEGNNNHKNLYSVRCRFDRLKALSSSTGTVVRHDRDPNI